MTYHLQEDFKTLEEVASQAEEILHQVRENGRPVVVTKDGKPAAVLLDVARYEQMVHLLNLSRMLNEGLEDVRVGRVKSSEEVFKEFGLGKKKASR